MVYKTGITSLRVSPQDDLKVEEGLARLCAAAEGN